MARTAIVEGFRSPFCKEGSDLKNIPPEFLGAMMVSEMVRRMKNMGADPKLVDFVVGSNVATPAYAPNIARVAAVKGGLDPSIPADTIGKNCGSGIAAVNYGDLLIKAGRAHTVVVVGVELDLGSATILFPSSHCLKRLFQSIFSNHAFSPRILTERAAFNDRPFNGLFFFCCLRGVDPRYVVGGLLDRPGREHFLLLWCPLFKTPEA